MKKRQNYFYFYLSKDKFIKISNFVFSFSNFNLFFIKKRRDMIGKFFFSN